MRRGTASQVHQDVVWETAWALAIPSETQFLYLLKGNDNINFIELCREYMKTNA
jgi:hypothetical protein